MNQSEQMEALADLVGLLVEEADPRGQERILVEALHQGGWAQAVALWRRDRSRDWIQVLAKGPDDLLPNRGQVEGIFDGDLPRELPLGKRVLFADRMHGGIGLALGGINEALEIEDLLEGMFSVFVSLTSLGSATGNAAGGSGSLTDDLLDLLQGPSPRRQERPEDRGDDWLSAEDDDGWRPPGDSDRPW